MATKEETEKQIFEIETQMNAPDFWSDKDKAQAVIREYEKLKSQKDGGGEYDKGSAVLTIFSGAGGDDAEDFARILLEMYMKFFDKKGWSYSFLHENKNDHGGYRNITLEIDGKNVYGTLKNESGVHRLVRISPFSSRSLRHTSFCLVEFIPKFEKVTELEIPEDEVRVEFARSGGPGGQNVNKRETAVRVIHEPTNISVHVSTERSQAQNREKAMQILAAKLYKIREDERIAKEKGMYISKTTEITWGNQIRSYVFHPYQLVKDHRTNVETRNIKEVLDGDIDLFLEAEKNLS
jgi:peptide chain release factor 2